MRILSRLLVTVALAAGCAPSADPPATASSDAGSPDEATPVTTPANAEVSTGNSSEPVATDIPSKAPESVELKIATYEELQATIAGSAGKVVVVDFWSTQCGPCIKEFPGLVALHQELPSSQLRCLSASLDYEDLPNFSVEEAHAEALSFLETQNATLENFILSEDSLIVLDEKLKLPSIPIVQVFDVDGKLARTFDESSGESFTYEADVAPFVRELLAKRFSSDGDE